MAPSWWAVSEFPRAQEPSPAPLPWLGLDACFSSAEFPMTFIDMKFLVFTTAL